VVLYQEVARGRALCRSDLAELPGKPVTGPVVVSAWEIVNLRAELP
jgi:hypothetical protein